MKTLFYTKTLIALAVAVAAAAAAVSQAQEQPIPPPAADSALPADIVPGTPLADVVKMVQAGVDAGTVRSYIVNSQSAFNLDADKIIYLKDMGVPSDLVNAMMDRDKTLFASTVAPPPAPAPVTTVAASAPDTAPPPAEVTVNYFYDTLSPYGSWVNVDGYGRCWRPTVVNYDSSWRPYCDRGHWVYTDCGWYWDSDYSWGVAFHYGRWFQNPRFGWCWYPDTVWAPSWVAWRSGGEYCGWAPLPPFADFRPGFGFYYRGASVAVDFDFGLSADCFLFVHPDHFYDRHPRSFCVERSRVPQVFHQTTIINNYSVNNRTIVNRGISVDHIRDVTHRNIEPIHVGSLPNAGRQGWRGDSSGHSFSHGEAGNQGNRSSATLHGGAMGNNLSRHDNESSGHAGNTADSVRLHNGPGPGNVVVTGGNQEHHGTSVSTAHGLNPGATHVESAHSLPAQNSSSSQANNSGQPGNQPLHRFGPAAASETHLQPAQPSTPANGSTAMERRQFQNNSVSIGGTVHSQVESHPQLQGASSGQPQFTPRSDSSFNADRSAVNSERVTRNTGAPSGGGFAHGAAQLEQHQVVPPSQPSEAGHQSHVEAAQHNYVAPASNSGSSPSSQGHNGANNPNSGGNNGGSGHNSDNNRQNH